MKILWHSNAPWAPTGYGNQTSIFVPRLKALGHEMGISAFWGIQGGMGGMSGGIPVYPPGKRDRYGMDIIGAHANHFGADIVITLVDAWVMHRQDFGNKPWIPWYPVDSEPLPRDVFTSVNDASDRIVFSKHGEKMTKEAGLSCRYVPHGVETKVFTPGDMNEARKRIGFPQDVFLVGMVAANKGYPSRKAFDPQFKAFALFKKEHPDALLYVHSDIAQNGENGGVNLMALADFHGLRPGTDIVFCDQYTNLIGFPVPYMVDAYRSMDVHMLVSMGEGFGIPIVEAQSCGTPVITGDWTSMSELTFSGWKVAKEDADPSWTPLGAVQYQPRYGAILDALRCAYTMKGNQQYRSRARDGALPYDADKVTEKYWKPVLETIEENLK